MTLGVDATGGCYAIETEIKNNATCIPGFKTLAS
jgi:hypothetical protein